jgi:hypothetical protein
MYINIVDFLFMRNPHARAEERDFRHYIVVESNPEKDRARVMEIDAYDTAGERGSPKKYALSGNHQEVTLSEREEYWGVKTHVPDFVQTKAKESEALEVKAGDYLRVGDSRGDGYPDNQYIVRSDASLTDGTTYHVQAIGTNDFGRALGAAVGTEVSVKHELGMLCCTDFHPDRLKEHIPNFLPERATIAKSCSDRLDAKLDKAMKSRSMAVEGAEIVPLRKGGISAAVISM